ncbi:MAG: division/cell wall cluster transcriptional repressor MraZ [Actinomycetota bacterium]
MLFVGAFERQLDDKGRLALPANFRNRLGEHVYLAKGRGKSVSVVPAATFEADAAELRIREKNGEISLNALRALAASASFVTLDKQGRVGIDEQLRLYADLVPNSTVTVAGGFDRLEIWTPERYSRITGSGSDEVAGDDE